MKILNRLLIIWMTIAEKITGLKYPSHAEVLSIKGILKKAILDYAVISIPIVTVLIARFALENSEIRFKILPIAAIGYLLTFGQCLIIEFLWCTLLRNPRARKISQK